MNPFSFLQGVERDHLLEDLIASQQAADRNQQMDTGYRQQTPGYPEYAAQARKDIAPTPTDALALMGIPLVSDAAGFASDVRALGAQKDPELWQYALTGAGLLPGIPGGLGILAGRKAKTADLDMLKIAEEAEAGGMPRERIFDATGWFKGADGQWRFEIDDSAMKYHPQNMEPFDTPQGDLRIGTLGESVEHPGLFDAYQDMAGITSTHRPGYSGTLGSYQPPGPMGGEAITTRMFPKKDTALHEVQHGVQQREGFASGGNPDAIDLSASEGQRLATQLRATQQRYIEAKASGKDPYGIEDSVGDVKKEYERAKEEWKAFKIESRALREGGTREVYERLAGEVEARNVQTRLPLPGDDRRMIPPWLTEDVDPLDQIVRFR